MEQNNFPYSHEELNQGLVRKNLDFLRNLEKKALTHPAIDHPFLIKTANNEYESDVVTFMLVQMSKHVRIFTGAICSLMGRAPDVRSRFALFDNLYEELGRCDLAGAHYILYLRMLCSIGIDEASLDRTPTMPSMQALNNGIYDAVNGSFVVGLAWLGLGGELLIPNNFPYMAKGTEKAFGRDRVDWEFFKRHGTRDQAHNDDANALLALHMTEEEWTVVEKETMKSLDSRKAVWDELGYWGDKGVASFVRGCDMRVV